MRIFKYLLVGLVAVIVVAIVAVVVILETTDFNRYRPLIAAEVKAVTGRDLDIAGNFHLALSLTQRVTFNGVRLANAAWGTRPDMARLDRLEAEIKLLPLLSGIIVVKRVRLIGGDILLEIDKAGPGNWLFRRGDPAALAMAEADRAGPPPTVESVSIENSVVTFHDGQTGVSQQMKIAAMTATTRGIAVPVRIDLAGAANGVPLELAGTIGSAAGIALVPINIFQSLAGMTRTSALTFEAAGNNACSAALAVGRKVQAPAKPAGATIIDMPIDAVKDVGSALKGLLP